ncbi:MAG: hypothetical protein P8Z33_12025 [Gammaproteobacteria bacterium]
MNRGSDTTITMPEIIRSLTLHSLSTGPNRVKGDAGDDCAGAWRLLSVKLRGSAFCLLRYRPSRHALAGRPDEREHACITCRSSCSCCGNSGQAGLQQDTGAGSATSTGPESRKEYGERPEHRFHSPGNP